MMPMLEQQQVTKVCLISNIQLPMVLPLLRPGHAVAAEHGHVHEVVGLERVHVLQQLHLVVGRRLEAQQGLRDRAARGREQGGRRGVGRDQVAVGQDRERGWK